MRMACHRLHASFWSRCEGKTRVFYISRGVCVCRCASRGTRTATIPAVHACAVMSPRHCRDISLGHSIVCGREPPLAHDLRANVHDIMSHLNHRLECRAGAVRTDTRNRWRCAVSQNVLCAAHARASLPICSNSSAIAMSSVATSALVQAQWQAAGAYAPRSMRQFAASTARCGSGSPGLIRYHRQQQQW